MFFVYIMQRWQNLLCEAEKYGYDSMVAFTPENLYYMTGFWGEAVGILTPNNTTIVVPELEADRARAESQNCIILSSERGSRLVPYVSSLLAEYNHSCTDCPDFTTMKLLLKNTPGVTHNTKPFLNTRMVKDDAEIRILRRASRIIDGLFDMCTKHIVPGRTELELQAILMSAAIKENMFDTGYPSTLNPLIVAGGPNSSLPHAQPTRRKFKDGDMVTVDITLRHNGYVSDATRTFSIKSITEKAREVYEAVKESQRCGLKATAPGVSCSTIDQACRDIIQDAGYGRYFIHSTGHGIGLDVHEPPTISKYSDYTLRDKMAVTVEPGIYIPKKFGVRIEDSIIVGSRRKLMHRFTKDLVVI